MFLGYVVYQGDAKIIQIPQMGIGMMNLLQFNGQSALAFTNQLNCPFRVNGPFS